jgi:branched-chain amino acid transport system permease protein
MIPIGIDGYRQDYRLLRTAGQGAAVLLLAAGVAWLPGVVSAQTLDILNRAAIAAIGAIGLNLLTGTCGLISIGHAGFLALGGMVAAILGQIAWLPFPVILVCSAVAGGVVGLGVGLPALRLRGLYLVLSTLAFYYLFLYGVRVWQSHLSSVGALTGLSLPAPDLGIVPITSARAWFYLLGVMLVGVGLISTNILRSRTGRAWLAIRDHELVAASMGIHTQFFKLVAFTISSAITGFAGALLAYYNGTFSADFYTIELSIIYFAMIIIGGLGSIFGSILGALFVTAMPPLITAAVASAGIPSAWQVEYVLPAEVVLYGLLIVLVLLFWPGGLIALWRRAHEHLKTWPLGRAP